jgi:hypothetical protein
MDGSGRQCERGNVDQLLLPRPPVLRPAPDAGRLGWCLRDLRRPIGLDYHILLLTNSNRTTPCDPIERRIRDTSIQANRIGKLLPVRVGRAAPNQVIVDVLAQPVGVLLPLRDVDRIRLDLLGVVLDEPVCGEVDLHIRPEVA